MASGGARVYRDPPHDDSASPRSRTLPVHILVLIAGLAAALVGQGAYYRAAQWPVVVLLAVALLLALHAHPWSREDMRFVPLAACAALAGWAIVRAGAGGDIVESMGVVALLAGVTATVLVARRTTDVDTAGAAAVALGVLVALSGWLGVAWRISPWALEGQGLWRAATTVTYANAAAGLLAALALVALGLLVARRQSLVAALSACVVLTGLGATLSRGGFLAFAVGAAVLAALLGVRAVARAAVPPVLGAVVALAALLPSLSASSSPRPFLAAAGLLGGLVLTGWLRSPRPRHRTLLIAAVPVVVLLVLTSGDGWHSGTALRQTRFTAASPDRANATHAALQVVGPHPVVGEGPGRANLSWDSSDGTTFVSKYAHNEYLQLLAELGAVGLALLLALFTATAFRVRAGRRAHPSPAVWAGATAGLVALAVGSGLDFLWHVPAVPLVAALLIGITVPLTKEKKQS